MLVALAACANAQQLSSALFGRVVNGLTHEPVRRVSVRIYAGKHEWYELTDGQGRFKFPPLQRAEFGLMAHREGFTDRTYKVELSDFDDAKELPVELLPQGVISGKVVDGLGQPLERAEIQALRGEQVAGSEWTNDLGEYRLSGLDAGVYRIRANYRDGRESELDPTPITTASITKPGEFSVKPGAVIPGIDFTLNPVRPVSVRGLIHTEGGQPVDAARLWVDKMGSYGSVDRGKFEIADVSPGTYTISAKTMDKISPLYGSVTAEVHSEDVSGIDLTLHPIPKIEGQVQVNGAEIANLNPTMIIFQPVNRTQLDSMEFAKSDKSGAFTVGVIPGEYILLVQSSDSFDVERVTVDDVVVTNLKIKVDSPGEVRKLVIVLAPKKQP
jgi:hypothetical protein